MTSLWSRRTALMVGCAFLPWAACAAPTGYATLDNPAITVRDPAHVILVAITRAGGRLVAVGEHGVIILSDDNGLHWVQAMAPVNVGLTCVAFASPLTGWAAGHFGVILNTVDGGKTWTRQLDGIQANQLTLAAAKSATPTNTGNSLGLPLALRRANIFMAAGPDKPFLSLLVLGAQKIIAFGAYRLTMFLCDGCKTWVDWSLRVGDKLSHNLYGTATVGENLWVVGEAGMAFCSTDGGETFPAVTSPSAVTMFGVLGAADGSVIVFGVAGGCFRSTDTGKSWNVINFDTQDNLTAGRRVGNGHIIIVSEGGVFYRSTDNGNSFQPIAGIAPMAVFDFEAIADDTLVAVGQLGAARITIEPL